MKNQDRLKARPLAPNRQVVNAKETFLKETESTTPVNTEMIREKSRFIADMEKVLMV